jgi:hypothetical protein
MENIRPTFLTVLCVLTFLGSAMGLYSAITNYSAAGVASGVTQEAFDEIKDKIEEEGEDQPGSKFAGKILDSVSENLTEEKIKNANSLAFIRENSRSFGVSGLTRPAAGC